MSNGAFTQGESGRGLQREFEILTDLTLDVVPRPLGLEHDEEEQPYLILEDGGGQVMASQLKEDKGDQPLSADEFLPRARATVEALSKLHRAGLIHKNLYPGNLLIDESMRVWLTGLDGVCQYPYELVPVRHPNALNCDLAYASPERLGRTGRPLDYRTDYYSLGVLFYRMLTGRLPHPETGDPLELIRAKLTRIPETPESLVSEIPRVLSRLVMKLLSISPESRYATAHGILADLDSVGKILEEGRRSRGFPLGREDFSSLLSLPGQLYAREEEIEVLGKAVDAAKEGRKGFLLITGQSGAGKTALGAELVRLTAEKGARMASGRYDPRGSIAPYAALSKALSDLVLYLHSEGEEASWKWKEAIEAELGTNAGLIGTIVPELELIAGPLREPVPLPPIERQTRFTQTMVSFFQLIATEEHPLVLFLDDLQWLDSATRAVLELLLTHPRVTYLTIVGAVRTEGQHDPSHPVFQAFDEWTKSGIPTQMLTLRPLGPVAIGQFVTDALSPNPELRGESEQTAATIREITNLLSISTEGNPLVFREFLLALNDRRRLTLTGKQGRADWKLDTLHPGDAATRLSDILQLRLNRLPSDTQFLLQLAASIGSQFDLSAVAYITGWDLGRLLQALGHALQQGLLIFAGDKRLLNPMAESQRTFGSNVSPTYFFPQDAAAEAAYLQVPDEERVKRHLMIGRLYLREFTQAEGEAQVFSTLRHLNAGRELAEEVSESITLTELNLAAATKATQLLAYGMALDFLTIAYSSFEPSWWKQRQRLSMALFRQRAELEYLHGNIDGGNQFAAEALKNAATPAERAEVWALQVVQLSALGREPEAIQIGLNALKKLGVNLGITKAENKPRSSKPRPLNPEYSRSLRRAYQEVRTKLQSEKNLEALRKGDGLTSAQERNTLTLMRAVLEAACYHDRELWYLLATKMCGHCLAHGINGDGAIGLAIFGVLNSQIKGDFDLSYTIGEIAERTGRRFQSRIIQGQTGFLFARHLMPWKRSLHEIEPVLDYANRSARISGDLSTVIWILTEQVALSFYRGELYEETQEHIDELASYCHETQSPVPPLRSGFQLLSDELHGATPLSSNEAASVDKDSVNPEVISKGAKNDPFQAFIDRCSASRDHYSLGLYLVVRGVHLLILGYYEAARSHFEVGEDYLGELEGTMAEAWHCAGQAITLAELFVDASFRERPIFRRKIRSSLDRLAEWSGQCPTNFKHLKLLVQAGADRLDGAVLEAIDAYDQAASAAQLNGFFQFEALSAEKAAACALQRGNGLMAASYATHARRAVLRWGCKEKLRIFDIQFSDLLEELGTGLER